MKGKDRQTNRQTHTAHKSITVWKVRNTQVRLFNRIVTALWDQLTLLLPTNADARSNIVQPRLSQLSPVH